MASYLLVATLPGEVQEAGGEQLVFGPGITVHGACVSCACAPAASVRESAELSRSERGSALFGCLPSTCVSSPVSVCVCLPRWLLRRALWELSSEQQRCAGCSFPLSRGPPPLKKRKSGTLARAVWFLKMWSTGRSGA